MTDELYIGREQTLVKHVILRKYLERFAHIVGTFAEAITYVDCFSGPWNVRSERLEDRSFSIALEELRKARTTLAGKGRTLKLRCMFLEKDPAAYGKLKEFTEPVTDAEIETRNRELAAALPDVLQFIRKGGRSSFPFIFIDPTGWTGFDLKLITPLLRLNPGEVLINFMTDYIRRFIVSPDAQTQESFEALFGSTDVKAKIQGLAEERDREDALVQGYAESVRRTGGFSHTCAAIVLHPEIDRSYFHLIYATRHRKGVEVFKEAEKKAMPVMEQARADARQRKRQKKSPQGELFPSAVLHGTRRLDELRERYLTRAKQEVLRLLRAEKRLAYDKAWDQALSFPLVWESDLDEWVRDWRGKVLDLEGMKPRQRVPQCGQGILLVVREQA